MPKRSITKTVVSKVLLLALLTSLKTLANADIESIRVRQSPERTRIVFDLSRPVEHRLLILQDPLRLVIDIKDASLRASLKGLDLKETPIRSVRSGKRNGRDLRVVLDLTTEVKPKSFALQPILQYGDRLVIDLYTAEQQVAPVINNADRIRSQMRDVVIAIDPGHGGDDPGAIGRGNLYEKDVVLSIAKKIHAYFEAEAGFKPILIRTKDYYVDLKKRTQIARSNRADLLISIHADAFRTADVRGASVYAVSEEGATSETARRLAERENRSDLIGGVGDVSLDDKDDLLAGVLLDLSATASLAASIEMGESILDKVKDVTRLHKKEVEQAAFVVLVSPDIPSLLIETGYISNPQEARALRSPAHQKKLSLAIFQGIKEYVEAHPPPGSFFAWKKRGSQSKAHYVIVRGDTISTIAQRYRVSMESLRRLNRLSTDTIRIGQVLQIPTS